MFTQVTGLDVFELHVCNRPVERLSADTENVLGLSLREW